MLFLFISYQNTLWFIRIIISHVTDNMFCTSTVDVYVQYLGFKVFHFFSKNKIKLIYQMNLLDQLVQENRDNFCNVTGI